MWQKLRKAAVRFIVGEEGPTSIEYAVLLALIIVACVAAVQFLGEQTNEAFMDVADNVGPTGP